MDQVIRFLTGDFPYCVETRTLGIAITGAMAVRNGLNKNKTMNWFHAYVASTLAGFGGGFFGFLWMAKPASVIASDLNIAASIIAFVVVNYSPGDIGYKLLSTVPGQIMTVSFAQIFRCMGMIGFVNTAFAELKPSAYYPIPVIGPILWATLLLNMGGLFGKGVDGYMSNGMPWLFQCGLFCAGFYHFYAHDQTGPIGTFLRDITFMLGLNVGEDADDKKFALAFVSGFMQVMGWLQLPAFLGPSFSPFNVIAEAVSNLVIDDSKENTSIPSAPKETNETKSFSSPAESEPATEKMSKSKARRKKNANKGK